jgi:hypothetical protein
MHVVTKELFKAHSSLMPIMEATWTNRDAYNSTNGITKELFKAHSSLMQIMEAST